MDTPPAQWPPQVKSMEEIMNCSNPTSERKIRPQKERALNCPRCKSTNTKFCYYNNYSLSQPRYFCKTCRRYWTEGGSLRNIPVGGGSRKKNRPSSSTSSPSSSISNPSKKLPNLIPPTNPRILDPQDLNLGFALHNHHHHHHRRHDYKDISEMTQLPNFYSSGAADKNNNPSSSSPPLPSSHHFSFLTGLTAGATELYPSAGPGFGLPEFKPSLNFSLDGLGSNFGSFQSVPETSGKLLFPFEDLKVSNNPTEDTDQNGDHNSTGYWSGVIGGGSW